MTSSSESKPQQQAEINLGRMMYSTSSDTWSCIAWNRIGTIFPTCSTSGTQKISTLIKDFSNPSFTRWKWICRRFASPIGDLIEPVYPLPVYEGKTELITRQTWHKVSNNTFTAVFDSDFLV